MRDNDTHLLDSSISEPSTQIRRAVAINCEMVGVSGQGVPGSFDAVTRLSVVDFLTCEILIDALVDLQQLVNDWCTQQSGISYEAMQRVIVAATALIGVSAARTELVRFVDDRTIVVVHALREKLNRLGIYHEATVDTLILAQSTVSDRRSWSLWLLCKELINMDLSKNGKKENSAETALAAREVVLCMLGNEQELKEWGKRMKEE